MKAEIIAVGTELLMGQIDNTDASYMSKRFPECGVYVYYHTVVGDNRGRLAECINIALKRADVVVLTGGLGPTQDDITKETVAEVLGLKPVFHPEILENVKEYFNTIRHNRKINIMAASNEKLAYYPEGCVILPNKNGTAPGCIISHFVEGAEKTVILLPGPPWELQPMFDNYVVDYFKSKIQEGLKSVYLRMFGIGESAMESVISDIVSAQTNPTIAPYAKKGEVMLRVTARYDKGKQDPDLILKPILDILHERLGEYIYSEEDLELKVVTANLLMSKNITVSFAESCTGGMLSELLTDVPGISKVFFGSVVAYSNEIKQSVLNVKSGTLEKYGAVSENTAKEMAQGVRLLYNTEVGISITGIAGPSGAVADKPVGRVYIGISTGRETLSYEYTFSGDRDKVRYFSCLNALNILRLYALSKG